MVSTDQFYGVIDMIDDALPSDVRQLALLSQFLLQRGHLARNAGFIVIAVLGQLTQMLHDASSLLVVRVLVGLIDKTFLVINLDHAALGCQRFDHIVAHVAHVIT